MTSRYLLILLLTAVLVSSCGQKVLQQVLNFSANTAPEITSITTTKAATSALAPNQTMIIKIEAFDREDDTIEYSYLVDIGSVVVSKQEKLDGKEYITLAYTLPGKIPAGFDVSLNVEVSDAKLAKSSKSINLGTSRVGLGMSGASLNGLFTQPNGDIQVDWSADGDGFFQVQLVAVNTSCAIQANSGFQYYSKGTSQSSIICGKDSATACDPQFRFDAATANLQKKLCIVIRDNLQQDASISFLLTSDDTAPSIAMSTNINLGTFSAAQSITLTCTDNFACDKIGYAEGLGTTPADPDFGSNGITVSSDSVNLSLGAIGNGSYTFKFRTIDKAGNASVVQTISYSIDSDAPAISINSNERNFMSTLGYTSSNLNWQSNKTGNYQLKIGSCVSGTNLTGTNTSGSYGTINTPLVSVITASLLALGSNSIRICFTATSGLTGEAVQTIDRNENRPQVTLTNPVDNATNVSGTSSISITFNRQVQATTVTSDSSTTCTGSFQVSGNGFTNCIIMTAAPAASGNNTKFTITSAGPSFLSPAGVFNLKVTTTVTDIYGMTMASDYVLANGFTVIGDVNPYVLFVSGSTANNKYGVGTNITLLVKFSENVNVTGTPQLALATGATANYLTGTGTQFLQFSYIVGSGQNSSDLDYASTTALTLSGGSIKSTGGAIATLTLPTVGGAQSLAGNKAYVIDTINTSTVSAPSYTAGPASNNISWTHPGGEIIQILVRRATGGFPASCTSGGISVYNLNGISFIDANLIIGTTYYYRICTVDNSNPGNISTASQTGTAVATTPNATVVTGSATITFVSIANGGNVATVSASSVIAFSVFYSIPATGTALNPITFGIAPTPDGVANSKWEPYCSTVGGSLSVGTTLTVPSTAGTYYIMVRSDSVFCNGGGADFWPTFTLGAVAGVLIVP